ncbi:MAG: hypothetical protein ACOY5W_09195 [Pseudomonadota bacterium]
MSTVPRRALVGKAGQPLPGGVKLSVFSHYPQDVALSGPNGTVTLSMTAMGTDPNTAIVPGIAQAGYYAHHTISGLSGFSQHSYTLTQAGTPEGTLTFAGQFMTAPGQSDDFALIFYSCFRGTADDPTGAYSFASAYARKIKAANPSQLPLLSMVGADDIMYLDSFTFDDSAQALPHKTDDLMHETVYQHCIKWMAHFGMMYAPVTTTNAASKLHCQDNVNQIGIWGDHEIFNDVGYGATSGTFRLDGVTGTVARALAAESAWDIFWTPGNGTQVDAGSRAHVCELGRVQLVAIDRNYGDGSNREGNGAFLLSDAQVSAVKTAIQGSSARFRIVYGAAEYHESGVADYYTMSQAGIFSLLLNGADGLLAKHGDDGAKFVLFHGDMHECHVNRHNRSNGGGTLQEQFLEFNAALFGVPNGGFNLLNTEANSSAVASGWFDWSANDYLSGLGINPEYRRLWDYGGNASLRGKAITALEREQHHNCLLVEVFQSETPLRVRVSLINSRGWSRLCSFDYLDDGGDNLPTALRRMAG